MYIDNMWLAQFVRPHPFLITAIQLGSQLNYHARRLNVLPAKQNLSASYTKLLSI